MKKKTGWYLLLLVAILFSGLTTFYYYVPLFSDGVDKLFLTVSTFLFAIFTGFFISRQGARYSLMRDKLTTFDGHISSLYRNLEYFGPEAQRKGGEIFKAYFEPIVNDGSWDHIFSKKSTIIKSTHALLREIIVGKVESLENSVLSRIQTALHEAQIIRKNVLALKDEHIPKSQWTLVFIISFLLLLTLSITIPSHLFILGALLKAAFATAVIFVLILLYQLDTLRIFETSIGETSARDVLEIIEGDREKMNERRP